MKKERCMLARKYEGQGIRGWLMSEKLDGVRALWTGDKLISRNGLTFNAPEWFLRQLPKGLELDGELWMGRGTLQRLAGVVRSESADWSDVRYCVFDAPTAYGGLLQRLSEASYQINKCLSRIAYTVEQFDCKGKKYEQEFFYSIIAQGGEGVVLRKADAPYECTRSRNYLKHKLTATAEALVVGHNAGKSEGETGSLAVVWGNVRFDLGAGLTKALKLAPPEIGSMVTFQYEGLTDDGIPRSPVFVVVRNYEGIPYDVIPQLNLTCTVTVRKAA